MGTSFNENGRKPLTVRIVVRAAAELKDLAGLEADKANIPLSEWIVRVVAKQIGRRDLAEVPRKKLGRPRKSTHNGTS
jgi:hypothetical protein